MKRIRDTVYDDYIKFNDDELEVIDTNMFQRLRRIKQLGFSSITYPGANHSRFEHSLGVFYVTQQVCDNLENISEGQERDLKYAALLHDIGHGPFSHVSEFVSERYGTSHEELSIKKIKKLDDVINGDVDRIIDYIKGNRLKIISGHIDTDRMDYLKRDSFKCGIEHGNVELPTLFHSLNILDGEVVFDENSLSTVESLLIARSHMIKSVYTHHASMGAELMVVKALNAYCEENSVEQMMKLDDYDAKNELLGMDREESKYFERVLNRNLFKVAYTAGIDDFTKEELKEIAGKIETRGIEIENEIGSDCGVGGQKIILSKPKDRIKDLSNKIKIRTTNGNIKNADEMSPLIDALEELGWYNNKVRVYCPEEHKKEVTKSSSKIMNSLVN